MSLATGLSLGHYQILGPLGSGSMGEVYRARDCLLGRDVAIKVLHASLCQDPDRLLRFQQEAQAAGALNHPNLLVVHDLGTHEGRPFLVTELLEGESLARRLARSPIAPRRAVEYAAQIARGLAAAHAKGIVHRDIKPSNLFITEAGVVKILDFGLSKTSRAAVAAADFVDASTTGLRTAKGVVLGTSGYMSPERSAGCCTRPRASSTTSGSRRAGTIPVELYRIDLASGRRKLWRALAPNDPVGLISISPVRVSADLPLLRLTDAARAVGAPRGFRVAVDALPPHRRATRRSPVRRPRRHGPRPVCHRCRYAGSTLVSARG